MTVSLDGKIAIVTGAGAGLGRAEALALAAAGADIVLNDVSDSAEKVAAEIEAHGVRAELVVGDVSQRATADALIDTAVRRFGGLHVLVNNAGVLRDRMLFSLSDEDWDTVINVHLRGHFLLSRNASAYWRDQSKTSGGPVGASVINTASEAFLAGSPGQANYAAAKAGITALTLSTARGLARYGVRANAIAPRARTAMTAGVFGDAPAEGTDPLSPEHVAPLVTYLASPAASAVSGQVFVVYGGMIAVLAAPTVAQRFDNPQWTPDSVAGQLGGYFESHKQTFAADDILALGND